MSPMVTQVDQNFYQVEEENEQVVTLNKFLEKQNLSMKAFSVSNKTRQKRSSTDPWGNPYKSTNKAKETRRPTAR